MMSHTYMAEYTSHHMSAHASRTRQNNMTCKGIYKNTTPQLFIEKNLKYSNKLPFSKD